MSFARAHIPPTGGGPEARLQSTSTDGASLRYPTLDGLPRSDHPALPWDLAQGPCAGRRRTLRAQSPRCCRTPDCAEARSQSRIPNASEPVGLSRPSLNCTSQHHRCRPRTPRWRLRPTEPTRPRVRGRIAPGSAPHTGSRSRSADHPMDRTGSACGRCSSGRREDRLPNSSTIKRHGACHGMRRAVTMYVVHLRALMARLLGWRRHSAGGRLRRWCHMSRK
jgi:hypothetical protein